MQPRDRQQEDKGVAQGPQQQQEVRIQCPYTASSCPLFNPTFSVAEVLAPGSSAPSPPTKTVSTPLALLSPPPHPSFVDSMRSACAAGSTEGEVTPAFAYTDYSIAPSPETLTRSLRSSTGSASTRGSGSPPSLPGSAAMLSHPPNPLRSPSLPNSCTPLPFNTPSGFRLPSPETLFSPPSALEPAAFASGSGSRGAAYGNYRSPRTTRTPYTSTSTSGSSYSVAPLQHALPSANAANRFDSTSLPPPPLPSSRSYTPQPSSTTRPYGLGFSSPSLNPSAAPMPVSVPSDACDLVGLEGLASAAAAALGGAQEERPRKRRRTADGDAGAVGAGEEVEEGQGSETASGGEASTLAAAGQAGAGPSATAQPGAEVATPFISKLHHLLHNQSYADVIRWNSTGTCLLYSHTSPRLLQVLGRFFRHTAISSLARQLNIYSFRRLATHELLAELERSPCPIATDVAQTASEFSGFVHVGFWRDQEGRERCQLARLKPKQAGKKKGEAAGGEKKRKTVVPGARKAEREDEGQE
ncbi:heat shock transcription factor [Rhodotorula toruloides]|uniref:Heat shock transcription factor n=1 Tax=Rhodotorula toruloides TaxID=5286 RepID=A0A511KS72_RHOTO|nr:heat shock transcription factor [Rhodotorula toruloides]